MTYQSISTFLFLVLIINEFLLSRITNYIKKNIEKFIEENIREEITYLPDNVYSSLFFSDYQIESIIMTGKYLNMEKTVESDQKTLLELTRISFRLAMAGIADLIQKKIVTIDRENETVVVDKKRKEKISLSSVPHMILESILWAGKNHCNDNDICIIPFKEIIKKFYIKDSETNSNFNDRFGVDFLFNYANICKKKLMDLDKSETIDINIIPPVILFIYKILTILGVFVISEFILNIIVVLISNFIMLPLVTTESTIAIISVIILVFSLLNKNKSFSLPSKTLVEKVIRWKQFKNWFIKKEYFDDDDSDLFNYYLYAVIQGMRNEFLEKLGKSVFKGTLDTEKSSEILKIDENARYFVKRILKEEILKINPNSFVKYINI